MPENLEIIFTKVDNCAGIEVKTAAGTSRRSLRAGDRLVLRDGDIVHLPVGKVTFEWVGDKKSTELTAPATLFLGGRARRFGTSRWRLFWGTIYYYGFDKPFGKPEKDEGTRTHGGVRG